MKRHKPLRRTKFKTKYSLKYDMIEGVLFYLREIKKMENGFKCQICGRHQSELPFPLSSFHILSRGSHPRLVIYSPNILIACWAKPWYLRFCHNDYHHLDKDSTAYKNLVKKIEIAIGLDLPTYKDRLKIAEVTLPRLTFFNIENQRFAYKHEYERLKHKEVDHGIHD